MLSFYSQIVRINGSSTTDDGVIILGAHQDSTNMWPFLPAPGILVFLLYDVMFSYMCGLTGADGI